MRKREMQHEIERLTAHNAELEAADARNLALAESLLKNNEQLRRENEGLRDKLSRHMEAEEQIQNLMRYNGRRQ